MDIDYFAAADLLTGDPETNLRQAGYEQPLEDRRFTEPYFVTPHAMDRFRRRVDGSLSDREIIRVVQSELQKRRLVLEPEISSDYRVYACSYPTKHGDKAFYCCVGAGESDKGDWPSVVTIKGEGSVIHGKLSGNQRLIREKGPAHIVRLPTLVGELRPYWERYTDPAYQQAMRPLRVTIEVEGPVGGYDAPTLDGLLAWAVVHEALQGHALDDTGSPYLLPAPLYRLWTCPDTGLPLWAANHFAPVGPVAKTVSYWHKRAIRPEHARPQKGQPQPYSIKGRYKEKRVPLPAVVASYWWADCVGDPDEVLRLIGRVEVVGKKRMALVRGVSVEPLGRFAMNRPVPIRYFDNPAEVQDRQYQGWTPPYWPGVPECQAECGLLVP